jgi:hypothetical protein
LAPPRIIGIQLCVCPWLAYVLPSIICMHNWVLKGFKMKAH